MISRRGFLAAALLAGAGCAPGYLRSGYSAKDVAEEVLSHPNNVNTIAKFLLENDLKKRGESLFVVHGSVDDVRVLDATPAHVLLPAYDAVSNEKPVPKSLADKVISISRMQGNRHPGFDEEIKKFLSDPTGPAKRYFTDMIDFIVDGSTFGEGEVNAPRDTLLTAHGHPIMTLSAGLSGADKRREHFRNAFTYSSGILWYLYNENGRDGMVSKEISDEPLVFDLDLIVSRLHVSRDMVIIEGTNEDATIHRMDELKYSFLHVHRALTSVGNPERKKRIEETVVHIYDKLRNRFEYIDLHDRQPDAFTHYKKHLLFLDSVVNSSGLDIPKNAERDDYLDEIRESKVPKSHTAKELEAKMAGLEKIAKETGEIQKRNAAKLEELKGSAKSYLIKGLIGGGAIGVLSTLLVLQIYNRRKNVPSA